MNISQYDDATLDPSFEYLMNDSVNCGKAIKKLSTVMSLEKATAQVREQRGCLTISEKIRGETDDYEYYCCPCSILNPSIYGYFQMATMYKNGVLPFSGGLLEQPATAIAIIERMLNLMNEHEAKESKRATRKRK